MEQTKPVPPEVLFERVKAKHPGLLILLEAIDLFEQDDMPAWAHPEAVKDIERLLVLLEELDVCAALERRLEKWISRGD